MTGAPRASRPLTLAGARRRALCFAPLALGILAGCQPEREPARFAGDVPAYREGGRFAVVGDTQRTGWLEFWREGNDRERALVMRAVAGARPAFLAITGDLVFDGASARAWAELDESATPIRDAGIPVFTAFGNHEYWSGAAVEPRLFARFPHLGWMHWYTVAYGPVRLVLLDSNEADLSEEGWKKQLRWYEATLAQLDADPAVRGVLVLLHHPPYTNSTVTRDEEHVQRWLVPPLLRARKTLAMMSGHVHSYERFSRDGKTFIVSGGGGGPRAKLLEGSARRHPDDLFHGPPLRDFNFVLMEPKDEGIAVKVMGLAKGGSAWREMDVFTLAWKK